MKAKHWIALGALLGGIGVALGAYGVHGLQSLLEARVGSADDLTKRLADWNTAVRYQMVHALALVLVGLVAQRRASWPLTICGVGFLLGAILFSGGLYGFVLTSVKPLVHVVPVGGVAYIVGWLALLVAALRMDDGGAA